MFTQRFLPAFIGLFVFLLDLATKAFTHTYLPLMKYGWLWYPYGGIGVFKNFLGIEFSITHQVNYGAAWGLFAEYQMPLLYLRMGLIAALLIYSVFFNKHKGWNIPLALIIAGAAGNVLDYYVYGHVVDMLHFVLWGYDYPVFNIADSAIFIGIASLLLISCLEKKAPAKARR